MLGSRLSALNALALVCRKDECRDQEQADNEQDMASRLHQIASE
jgi:hypothetical protein